MSAQEARSVLVAFIVDKFKEDGDDVQPAKVETAIGIVENYVREVIREEVRNATFHGG